MLIKLLQSYFQSIYGEYMYHQSTRPVNQLNVIAVGQLHLTSKFTATLYIYLNVRLSVCSVVPHSQDLHVSAEGELTGNSVQGHLVCWSTELQCASHRHNGHTRGNDHLIAYILRTYAFPPATPITFSRTSYFLVACTVCLNAIIGFIVSVGMEGTQVKPQMSPVGSPASLLQCCHPPINL